MHCDNQTTGMDYQHDPLPSPRVGGERRGGTKMPATSAPAYAVPLRARCQTPESPDAAAALAGRYARRRRVFRSLIASSAWKLPCWPVSPWITTREFLLTKILMVGLRLRPAQKTCIAASSSWLAVRNFRPDCASTACVLARRSCRRAYNHGLRDLEFAIARHHAFRNPLRRRAGKDVDEHDAPTFDRKHDAKRIGDLLRPGAAADVESLPDARHAGQWRPSWPCQVRRH